MTPSYPSGPSVDAGLCGRCRHARRIPTARGSVFLMCLRSTTDPAYPRYPVLPVRRCRGFDEMPPAPPAEPETAE